MGARAKPPESESFGGPLADIVHFTNLLTYLLSILWASKGDGKFVNFSVIPMDELEFLDSSRSVIVLP